MTLVIDNYDSFTYNLVQYLGELGEEVIVRRNDVISLEDVRRLGPDRIVISPGPKTPNEAGLSCVVIQELGKTIPILGVCLGHQCIGQVFGGRVVRAQRLMHGKTSLIYHNGSLLFERLPNPFEATRYHSLIVDRDSVPDCLEITAETDQKEVMGLRHKTYPIFGVQFHPESILTRCGKDLLRNFLSLSYSAAG
ncbi:anthranilate synthase component II [Candidatus Methylacidithermus pantelleriae]|uniref:Aminodeoxychorismate synthase subunit 2 n=1 Tax=Candidatus Methylacidithermus pantelleriae TaxID=2744239 RepID=A0A8J2BK51_9BACT|nr:aminodeoxychorismate/anthranilate synthase component II [Candidatus Methylacidithermus pantelleriae]CAF0699012.1 aminodeoxychorismate synthase subunit 2 [Candidatus Methylacidithermus pantelleriae]